MLQRQFNQNAEPSDIINVLKTNNDAMTGNIASSLKTIIENPDSRSLLTGLGNCQGIVNFERLESIKTWWARPMLHLAIPNVALLHGHMDIQDNITTGDLNVRVYLEISDLKVLQNLYNVRGVCPCPMVSIYNEGNMVNICANTQKGLYQVVDLLVSLAYSYTVNKPTYKKVLTV